MSGDQLEHQVRSARDGCNQPWAEPGPEHLLQGVRIVLQPWNDLSAVAPGSPIAHLGAFEHHDIVTRLTQMKCG
jgi:hypothetical protein